MSEERRQRVLAELQPYIERARAFSGWSFPQIRVAQLEPGAPWDYEALVSERLGSARAVLDLGTGGAELFARVIEGYQGCAVATEEWHVNAPVARDRLRPLGAAIVRASAERALPFRDGAFDLIIDRHEGIDPAEVARVVAPGGWFITQQVGREDWRELDPFFPRRTQWPDHFRIYQDELRNAGYRVEGQEHEWSVAYETLGDIAFMLLIAPWDIEGFDPVAEVDELIAFEDANRTARGIEMTRALYLITAHRPE